MIKYVLLFCFGVVSLLQLILIWSDPSLKFGNLRAHLVSDEYNPVSKSVAPPDASIPPELKKYFMYESSAKQALVDLLGWIESSREVSLPLFENRIDTADGEISSSPKVCLFLTTKDRPKSPTSCLRQTVTSILTRMDYPKNRETTYIHVFDVNKDSLRDDHSYIEEVASLLPVSRINDEAIVDNRKLQEDIDFTSILEKVIPLKCKYPIFIEDDAVADDHWFDLIEIAIDQLENEFPISEQKDWLSIRLFAARHPDNKREETESPGISGFNPMFGSVAFLMNPQYLEDFKIELERMIVKAKTDLKYLLPKDLCIDEFANQRRLSVKSFEPVIFQHVGLFSTVGSFDEKSAVDKANMWQMSSRYFRSEHTPISFDISRWII
jgi:hypothetical protein